VTTTAPAVSSGVIPAHRVPRRVLSRVLAASTVAVLGLLAPVGAVQAAQWSDHPIKIVVPYGAGGNIDLVARMLSQYLGTVFKTSVYIDNQAGADGNIGLSNIARAPADGSVVGMVTSATMTINPAIYSSMPVDVRHGLTMISDVATGPMAVIVHPSLPVHSMKELIDYAKQHPGKLNCASGSNGSLAQLTLELIKLRTGVDIVHVPFKSGAAALAATVAGHVQMDINTFSTTVPYAAQKQVRVLALTSAKRTPLMPDVPTVAESGLPDFSAESWLAMVGPPGMPQAMVAGMQHAIADFVAQPDVKARLASVGSEGVGGTPEQLSALIDRDSAIWKKVVIASKITVN
jgi:tripartite-type tricarboxylate transporter receptor subunit TctC